MDDDRARDTRRRRREQRERERVRQVVTDHAVVRWIERVEGIDTDAIRRYILAPSVEAALALAADGFIECQHPAGARVVCNTGRVVTVMTE